MNTTAAALQAGVTVPTIRTWCRLGAVAATKQAGRWIVDISSLTTRIAIGAMKAPARKAPKPVVLSAETMTAIGGNRWQRGSHDRVYLNDWEQYAGIEVTRYGTGNIASASLEGRPIANGRAYKLLGLVSKVYLDVTDGHLYVQHNGADQADIRYLNGDRDTVNLLARIDQGVRAAIATL